MTSTTRDRWAVCNGVIRRQVLSEQFLQVHPFEQVV